MNYCQIIVLCKSKKHRHIMEDERAESQVNINSPLENAPSLSPLRKVLMSWRIPWTPWSAHTLCACVCVTCFSRSYTYTEILKHTHIHTLVVSLCSPGTLPGRCANTDTVSMLASSLFTILAEWVNMMFGEQASCRLWISIRLGLKLRVKRINR